MRKLTADVPDDLLEDVDDYADENHGGTRAAAVRELLRRGLDSDQLEAERDDLRRQLQEATKRDREIGELVEYVEDEREIQNRREKRQRERERAGIITRAKWFVLGRDIKLEEIDEKDQ